MFFGCVLLALAACSSAGPAPGLVRETGASVSGFGVKRVSEQNDCYDLQMDYPVLGHSVIDGQVKKLVSEEYDATVSAIKDLCQRQKPEKPFKFWADYEVHSTAGTVSVVFKSWLYADGGGQYLDKIRTLNCLWDGGATLGYADLFGATGGLFDAISDHVHQALAPALKDAWEHSPEYAAALKPSEDCFERFAITKEGLMLYFPTRQVAPFYAGPQRAGVPVRQLARFSPRPDIWE